MDGRKGRTGLLIFCLIGAVVLVLVDYWIKLWAVETLKPIGTIPLIQDVLHLTYVENDGASFSILSGQRWFLIGITSVALVGIFLFLVIRRPKSKLLVISLSMILAGGVGNLIDRIAKGYVVDYIDFRAIRFAVFNFADCCAVIGTGLLLLYVLWTDVLLPRREKKQTALPESSQEQHAEETEQRGDLPNV